MTRLTLALADAALRLAMWWANARDDQRTYPDLEEAQGLVHHLRHPSTNTWVDVGFIDETDGWHLWMAPLDWTESDAEWPDNDHAEWVFVDSVDLDAPYGYTDAPLADWELALLHDESNIERGRE